MADEKFAVFVYGTLKIGGRFSFGFDSFRLSSEKASIKNMDMFSIGGNFPAIVPGKGIVHGELHKFQKKHESAILSRMDMVEGFDGEGNPYNLYNRVKTTVQTTSGPVEATLYIFNQDIKGEKKIENGVWKI